MQSLANSPTHPVTMPNAHPHPAQADDGLHDRLLALPGLGDPFDRHVLASAIVRGLADPERSLPEALGLDPASLAELLDTGFIGWQRHLDPARLQGDPGEPAIEEADFRRLLQSHGRAGAAIETWLAHIIVRRALQPDHLWSNLGVRSRKELSQTLFRHFGALAEQNVRDMRWKKFFYRQLCQTEGVVVCKSPVCDACPDYAECFSTGD